MTNDAKLSDKQNRKRIAIFHAFWYIHSNTAYAAHMLVGAGYDIDIFTFECINHIMTREIIANCSNISIYSFIDKPSGNTKQTFHTRPNHISRFKSLLKRGYKAFTIRLFRFISDCYHKFLLSVSPEWALIPAAILKQSVKIINAGQYQTIIGVEKGGLLWAGQVAQHCNVPLIYSSLELYTRDLPSQQGLFSKRLKYAEEKYHPRCWATIVQDEYRARVLLEDNGVHESMKLFYVPISRMGRAVRDPSTWLSEHFGISTEETLILSYGMISERRLSVELAKVAQHFNQNWRLVFHGFAGDSVITKIRNIDSKNRVLLSLDLVPASQEDEVVRSAHIGLVLYDSKTINDKLTAFSSEKMALYLQCGLPVIAFDYPGYEHIRRERCGILINNIGEIPKAIEQILQEYCDYRSMAFACYEKYYNFEKNFRPVVDTLLKWN